MTGSTNPSMLNTDYSRWERNVQYPRTVSLSKEKASFKGTSFLSVRPNTERRKGICQIHSQSTSRVEKDVEKEMTAKSNTLRRVNSGVLLVQIAALKKSIKECQEHFIFLVRQNVHLKEELSNKEKETHVTVADLLEKYHRFRGTMFLLKRKHSERINEAQKGLDQTETTIGREVKQIETSLKEVTNKVDAKRSEIKKLLTFKESEYPGNVIKIGKLKREIKQFDAFCKREFEEMLADTEAEEGKYRAKACDSQASVQRSVAEKFLEKISDADYDKAVQNFLMKKELAIQQNEFSVLEFEIEELKGKIRELKESRKNRRRAILSSWPKEKCHPDSDLSLDIPRQEHLPI